MSLEEATSARLPFDVAEHIDIEEEKEAKRKVEEYKQARAEHLNGLKGMLFANINNTPDILYITCLLSILALTLSTIVTIGCASVRDEKALLEWLGTTTKDFRATFFHFILPIPITLLVLSLLQGFIKVDKWYPSSQICHACGTLHPEMKDLKIRTMSCDCGLVIGRDQNAAINILNEGLRILASQ